MLKRRALIVCTGNACRSQMAEGLMRHLAGPQWEICSAGSMPAGYVHRYAIAAMAEIGIDIASHLSKGVTEFVGQEFDYLITVCDSAVESCPVLPGAKTTLHWPLDDPAAMLGNEEAGMAVARRVRDDLKRRLAELLNEDARLNIRA